MFDTLVLISAINNTKMFNKKNTDNDFYELYQ